MDKVAPILIFSYNRLDELQQTVAHLKRAMLSDQSILYIYSDGPKKESDVESLEKVREFLKTITGFKKIIYKFSAINKGLASSIIDGVSEVLENHDSAIILEDDLLVSDNFLVYMNQALNYYEQDQKVLSVCGYTHKLKTKKSKNYPYDVYFTKRSSSWGWATWKNKWDGIDWEVKDFKEFSENISARKKFNKWGSDMYTMLKRQQNGEINSWAIRYTYHQYKHDMYSVFPLISKIKNIGFNENATHTKGKFNRFEVEMDESSQTQFNFIKDVSLDNNLTSEFKSLYSLTTRIKYKILNLWPF